MSIDTHLQFVDDIIDDKALIGLLSHYSQLVVVLDDHVAQYYLSAVNAFLKAIDCDGHVYVLPAGEQHKSRESKQKIEDFLFEKQLDKSACLLALGGGVITDLVGFVGATYLRGIDVIYIPTSLMAMVDASIGGKTAINTLYGKNTLGVIRQPRAIFIDFNFLKTLPEEAYFWAFSEVFKHAVIGDREGIQALLDAKNAQQNRQHTFVKTVVEKSVAIKLSVIDSDVNDHGRRHLLNIGHTLAHALECVSDFSISHGEAVAWGLLYESRYAQVCGVLTEKNAIFIQDSLQALGLLIHHDYPIDAILEAMVRDKKSKHGKVRMPLITSVGKMLDCEFNLHEVDMDLMKKVLSS